jgi:nucleotide-binding universal stress UspA family protein
MGTAMNFVDRYWEWRRRRALGASLRSGEYVRELALVAELLMERRGVSRRRVAREQVLPICQVPAASDRSGHVGPRATRKSPRAYEQECSGEFSVRRTGGDERSIANGSRYSTILAAIDGTRPSAEVGVHAVRLADSVRAKLIVLSFINVQPASRMGVYRSLALAEIQRDSQDRAWQARKLAERSGVECEVRYARDPHPSRAIVAAAEEVRAGCLVIGSPGAS